MPQFIAQKMTLARHQLESARTNHAQGDIETAANRAFLAAENAAAAAIAKSGAHADPVHDQIRTDFEELCERGVIPGRFRGLLTELYGFRLRADYGRRIHDGRTIPDLTPDGVRTTIEEVAQLIDTVERMPNRRRAVRV